MSTKGEGGGVQVDENGVAKYLTGIISSSLSWIEDEDTRERIYEATSARLAERAGRTGKLAGVFGRLSLSAMEFLSCHVLVGTPTSIPTSTRPSFLLMILHSSADSHSHIHNSRTPA